MSDNEMLVEITRQRDYFRSRYDDIMRVNARQLTDIVELITDNALLKKRIVDLGGEVQIDE